MTRDELLKGLQRILDNDMDGPYPEDALRAAIAFLTPLEPHDIELARDVAEILLANGYSSCDPEKAETLMQALGALAREPGLVAAYDALEHDRSNLLCEREEAANRIAALEARLARVRDIVIRAQTHGHLQASAVKDLLDALDAALAADAVPAATPTEETKPEMGRGK